MSRVAELEAALSASREAFERWYVLNVFDIAQSPIGSRDCHLQWQAWEAASGLAPRKIVDEGMEQDARRYRWLRTCMWWRTDPFAGDVGNCSTGYWQTKLFKTVRDGQSLDNVIDAALAKEIEK